MENSTTPIRLRAFRAARFVHHGMVDRQRAVDHLVAASGDRAEVERQLEAGLKHAHLLPPPTKGQLEAEAEALTWRLERIRTFHELATEAFMAGAAAGRGLLVPAIALAAVVQRAATRYQAEAEAMNELYPFFEAGLRAGELEAVDAA